MAEKNVRKISPSAIKLYLQCPALYKEKYITPYRDRLKSDSSVVADAGTIVHKVLELAARDHMMPNRRQPITLGYLLDILDWTLREVPEQTWKEQTPLKAEIVKIATEILEAGWKKVDFTYTKQVEAEWSVDLGVIDSRKDGDPSAERGLAFGVFDRVDELPDGSILVVDYKTGNDVMSRKEAELDIQANLYVVAARAMWPDRDVGFELHYLSKGLKVGPIRWDAARDRWVRSTVLAAQFRILDGKFRESPGVPHCVYCPRQAKCESFKKMVFGPMRALVESPADNARDYDRYKQIEKIAKELKEANGARIKALLQENKADELYLGGYKAEFAFQSRYEYDDFARTVSAAAKTLTEIAKVEAERRRREEEAAKPEVSPTAPAATPPTPERVAELEKVLTETRAQLAAARDALAENERWKDVATRIGKIQKTAVDEWLGQFPVDIQLEVGRAVSMTSQNAGFKFLKLEAVPNPFAPSDPEDEPATDAAKTDATPTSAVQAPQPPPPQPAASTA